MMKPYLSHSCAISLLSLLFLLVGASGTFLLVNSAAQTSPPELSRLADAERNPLLKSGDQHYYNLEYGRALEDYEQDLRAHPGDCFAVNEVLKTVVFQELYRLSLLDTTLYAHDGFLNKTQPENADPKTRARVEELYQRALVIEGERLKANPNDVDALYCRGVTRGLKSTYMALVDKSFLSALRNAVGARRDHERVLELDPKYIDAKTVVGAHLYVAGSLPLPLKMLAGVAGLGGSKKKGLQYLEEVAATKSGTSVDARVALALFLRREARYGEALQVVKTLVAEHPRNFLFALEEANLLKDEGDGPAAAVAYRKLLEARSGRFSDAHLGLAAFGLGEVLRGQRDYAGAARAYDTVGGMAETSPQLKARALLAAGEMWDALGKREMALGHYREALQLDGTGNYAKIAQAYIKRPFEPER